jgi:enoyl-CoA hydratase/carnithine racemase
MTGPGPTGDAPAMEYETVLVEKVGGVGLITLHRPERKNAFIPRMWLEISTAFAAFESDDAVRAIVVTGSGQYFCVGADMSGGKDTFRDRLGQRPELVAKMTAPRAKPWNMSTPIIGAINGPAIGVGATLPLQWDIRLASADAKISFAFVLRGAIPEANSHWLLPRLIGASRATELLLTGRTITGQEAAEIGLVARAVAPEKVLAEAMALGQEIADNVAPMSASIVKKLINEGMESTDRIGFQRRENALFRWVVKQEDAREGVVSFLERRLPRWGLSKNTPLPPEEVRG